MCVLKRGSMPIFKYIALDQRGEEQAGTLQARDQTLALTNIRERGLFPTEVVEVLDKDERTATATKKKQSRLLDTEIQLPSFLQRVKGKQLMIFTRQLATLINAGLPLVRSLRVLQRQERNGLLKKTLSQMSEAIESGSTFAESLAQHPRVFNSLYVNMAKAGEVGGVLDQVLNNLADFMEKAQRVKGKVISAMAYPVLVMFLAVAILIVMMLVIIPKFEELFENLLEGQGLPPLTQAVMRISTGLSEHGFFMLGCLLLAVVLLRFLLYTSFGRFAADYLKLHLPLFGTLVQKAALARFSRTLGTLMTSGVPVLQALTIVRETAGNVVIGKAVAQVHDSVKEGESMAAPMSASKRFPPMVLSMVEVGEETGALDQMLQKIAENYDNEVDHTVAGLTSVIEPILIVFLAAIVGVIVIALFLPLISIIGNLG